MALPTLPSPSERMYMNIGFLLSATPALRSGRVLGPFLHGRDSCLAEFIELIRDPEADDEEYTQEDLDHFGLFKSLLNSTDTLVFSSATPRLIQDVEVEDFKAMKYLGMLHNILEIDLEAPSSNEFANYHPSLGVPLSADPSEPTTKALIRRLGLEFGLSVYTLYFVSQGCVGSGGLPVTHVVQEDASAILEYKKDRLAYKVFLDGNFPIRRR